MNIEDFREYCMSMEGVTEKMPFGKFAAKYDSILVFYVIGHMFCFIDIDDFTYVNVKATPEDIDQIRLKYTSVSNPINQSLRHWIGLHFNGDIPDSEIYARVEQAYQIVKQKYAPKKKN